MKIEKIHQPYRWSIRIFAVIFTALLLYLTLWIADIPPTTPEKLIRYEGTIKEFIKLTNRHGSTYFIDLQTDKEIKRLWFVDPITEFWFLLKQQHQDAKLTVYGRPYGAKRVHVWELHVNQQVLFTYDDRIKMMQSKISIYKNIIGFVVLSGIILLIILFPYEKKLHNRKIAQQDA